jgi:hypothetical protein
MTRDRMHMKVWRETYWWWAAPAKNGLVLGGALRFGSWAEAVAYAIQEAY